MFRICFIDHDLSTFDFTDDLNSVSETFLLDLSLYIGKDFTILDLYGEFVASVFDGLLTWC